MSRVVSAQKDGLGPALRWAGAGALVLGVHLGAGTLLLGRSMAPRQPDAAVVGIPIDLEPVTVPQDETAPAPAPPAEPPAASAAVPPVSETQAAAEPPPAAQASEPPSADPLPVEPQVGAAEPQPAIPGETPPPEPSTLPPPTPLPDLPPPTPLPDLPKAREADEAVLARPPPPRPEPKPKPKPKPKSVALPPPKTPVDRAVRAAERRDAAELEVARQERRDAQRSAARQRTADRRAAEAAVPAREPAEAQPRASASADEVASWRGALVAHLNRFKHSPPGGRSGTARVSFSVTTGGSVSGVRLASSSGDPVLDEAALAMVQRADPVPAPPSGMGARVSLSVPVHFSGP